MKDKIKNWIKDVLGTQTDFSVEYPSDFSFGDFATNVALIEAKKQNKNPKGLAEDYVKILEENKLVEIEKIEIAGPGFINLFLNSEFFINVIKNLADQGNDVGKNNNLKDQKIIIEYTDPNPFKEFHIGHLMSNSIGESISRIIELEGAEVKRACYQGDVGLHVASAIYGIQKLGLDIDKLTPNDLGKAYAFGATKLKEDEFIKNEIVSINKKIFEKNDNNINQIYEKGRKISLDYFEEIYKRLGTKFDYYFYESETGKFGKEIVEKNIGDVFEKSDGAVIFSGEKHDKNLHTRVFINKEGIPTYEAKELGLSKIKYDKYPYDNSIVITGNEINEYFKVLLKAMSFVFPELAEKTKHLSHGMLRLPQGKMSSRTGDVITGEFLLGEIKKLILEKMADREITDEKKEEIAEVVTFGALKYSILKQTVGKDIIFDFEKSISFEGDSGPYLQYSVVRANSILKKCKSVKAESVEISSNWKTTNLEKFLERFESVVERAGREYSPHYIVTYLTQLAGEFNSFYATNKVIDDTEFSPYKIAITKAFANVMTAGLYLLGIKVPVEM